MQQHIMKGTGECFVFSADMQQHIQKVRGCLVLSADMQHHIMKGMGECLVLSADMQQHTMKGTGSV